MYITRKTVQQKPHKPWKDCRKVYLDCRDLDGVDNSVIRRWLDQAGPYMHSLHDHNFLSNCDRIALFGPRFTKTPFLKELHVTGPLRTPGSIGTCDVLLLNLAHVPLLETLELSRVAFSSAETVESFLATSKSLKSLELRRVITSMTTLDEPVSHGFRRGLKQNQTLSIVGLFESSSDAIVREVLLGIMGNKHVEELKLYPNNGLSSQTSIAFRCLLMNSSVLRKLEFSGGFASLAVLFQGLSDNQRVTDVRVFVDPASEPRGDEHLASALSECFASNKTVSQLNVRGPLGPKSRAAFADSIAQVESLESLMVSGKVMDSTDVLSHAKQLRSVSLCCLEAPDWTQLKYTLEDQIGNKLKEFELTSTSLSFNDLKTLTSCFSHMICLEKLRLQECGITAEASGLLVDLIQQDRLKALVLHKNPLGTQGAKTILNAVRTSPSMERLEFSGNVVHQGEVGSIDLNDCREELELVLMGSRLTTLRLGKCVGAPMDQTTVVSLANGLRSNTYLKELFVSGVDPVHLRFLGDALAENRVLAYLRIDIIPIFDDPFGGNVDLRYGLFDTEAVEQSIRQFMERLARMTFLKKLDLGLNPCKELSEREMGYVVRALQKNTTLEHFGVHLQNNPYSDEGILFQDETVQYYLELNRLHRHQFLDSVLPGGKDPPLRNYELPLFFARMAKPEFASHLYYFLQQGAGLLHSGNTSSSSLKRKAI